MFGPVGTCGRRRQRVVEGYESFRGEMARRHLWDETVLNGDKPREGGRGSRLTLPPSACLFPLAINGRIRTGTDKGNPTV